MKTRARQLLDLGQSVWLDYIRRGHLVSGEFDRLVKDEGVVEVRDRGTRTDRRVGKDLVLETVREMAKALSAG